MVSLHLWLVAAHVLFAATTIGATLSYAVWIALAERAPAHLAFTIRAVRASDRLVAIPAYVLTFVTGAWLTLEMGIPFDRPWLVASIAIYLVVLVVGFVAWGPVVRRELAALESGGVADPEYRRSRDRARWLSLGTILALVVILVLMIARPGL